MFQSGFLTAYSSSVGSLGKANGQFTAPADVAADSAGNIWVLDSLPRLQKFNEKGEWLKSAGSLGTGAGQLSSPARG